jgi:hypothetical protein
MIPKHKIFAFIFFCATAIPLSCCIYLFIKQQIIHHEMAEALEKRALHTVTIKTSDARWINFESEILIGGHLFDVESYKQDGNNLQLTGLYDTEEDNLNEQLKNIEQKKSTGNFEYSLLANLLSQTFFFENNPSLNKNIFHKPLDQFHFSFDENLYTTFLNIIVPPPKA